jgi:hypothetical protein
MPQDRVDHGVLGDERDHGRSIFGMTKNHCAWPTSSSTSSASSAAVATDRFAAHDGHSSRVLHENGSARAILGSPSRLV